MAATSVTGTGIGSADGHYKGSEHMSLGVEKLVGPRIVIADELHLDGDGDFTLVLPLLPGVVGDYIVLATDADATSCNCVAAQLSLDNTNERTLLRLKGVASEFVAYAIVKKGIAI